MRSVNIEKKKKEKNYVYSFILRVRLPRSREIFSSAIAKKITKSNKLYVGGEISLRQLYRRNTDRSTSKRARDVRRRFDNGMRETTSRAYVDDSGRDRR